ncbi:MAG: LuxR C-terminal-related transcriptional regulator [Caldilineaceae bacterium]
MNRRAQENLLPDNLIYRISTNFALGTAYMFQGDKTAASQAFADTISIGENSIYAIARHDQQNIQETNNHLNLAAKTYESGLHLAGDPPPPVTCEGFLGLARIHYEWNDLDAAEQYGQQCFQMTQQMENVDSFAAYGVFLSRLKLVQGDVSGAAAALAEAEAYVRQHHFLFRLPDVVAAQVRTLLRGGNLTAAAHLAEKHDLPISQARVHLAQGNTHGALALLQPLRQQMEAKGWHDERLQIMIVQALVLQAQGETDAAVQLLGEALALAESGGFIRIFVDEGLPMAQLLSEAAARGIMPDYTGKLLSVFESREQKGVDEPSPPPTPNLPNTSPLLEPLTQREQEVLQLIVEGRSNPDIATQLVVALSTVKTHVKNIYGKLQVTNRFQAIARANELGLF